MKKIFIQWLKDNKVYENFVKEIRHVQNQSIDEYLTWSKHVLSHPGWLISYGFFFAYSITQKEEKAFSYWSDINNKWLNFLEENNIPDLSEIVDSD